jgi:hypothetical protein
MVFDRGLIGNYSAIGFGAAVEIHNLSGRIVRDVGPNASLLAEGATGDRLGFGVTVFIVSACFLSRRT